MADQQTRTLTTSDEEQRIARSVMVWVNTCPMLPETVSRVDFEQLPADMPGMTVSIAQGNYITRRYICGGHEAVFDFSVLYRIKPGKSNDARLTADEVLNAVGDWLVTNPPTLGDGLRVRKIETTARAALLVPYENGDEDHQIQMKLTYEVI